MNTYGHTGTRAEQGGKGDERRSDDGCASDHRDLPSKLE
jgi:hypothetical protein